MISLTCFIPPNPINNLIATLFNDEDTADLVLEVGEGLQKRRLYAHRLILTKCAPDLAALCEDCDKDKPLPLPDVDPEVFHELLHFVYGGKVAEDKWGTRYRVFIDTADKFGVGNLKIEAEVRYVKALVMTADNVVDILAYADSKNCSLLKECATIFMMNDPTDIMNSESFKDFPKSDSIIKEILFISSMMNRAGKEAASKSANCNIYNQLFRADGFKPNKFCCIDVLRQRLSAKGLDVDGPREVLIARLEGNN